MKRVILLFAAVLLASIGWSQTVTLKFKDGSTRQYNMSEIESIDFTDGNGNNSGNDDAEVEITEANIVGVWELVSYDLEITESGDADIKVGEKWYILSDGTMNGDCKWLLNGRQLTIMDTEPKDWSIPLVCWITKLTTNTMELYINYGFVIVTLRFKRVS